MESEWSRHADTAITIIILTLARLTATTDLAGLSAGCSLALARGMAGTADGAVMAVEVGDMAVEATDAAMSADAATLVDAGTRADVATLVDAAMRAVVEWRVVERSAVAVDFMVVAEAASTAAAATVGVVDMVAVDTGKFLRSLISGDQEQ